MNCLGSVQGVHSISIVSVLIVSDGAFVKRIFILRGHCRGYEVSDGAGGTTFPSWVGVWGKEGLNTDFKTRSIKKLMKVNEISNQLFIGHVAFLDENCQYAKKIYILK